MKESNKIKALKFMNVINIALCCLVAGIGVFDKNALAACGWLAAALAYMQVNDLRRYCECWKGIGSKTVDLFHSFFGTGGQILSVEVKRVDNNSEDDKKEKENVLPDSAKKAAESLDECVNEFLRYVSEGNREFSISHGCVTVSMSIPEADKAHDEGD